MRNFLLSFEIVGFVLSAVLFCVTFALWKKDHLRYFLGVTVCTFIMCAAHIIEITAPDLGGVIAGAKFYYFGCSFAGYFLVMFFLDFANHQRLKKIVTLIVIPISVFITLAVLFYKPGVGAYGQLMYKNVTYVTDPLPRGVKTPGHIYYFAYAYNTLFFFGGMFMLLAKFIKEKPPLWHYFYYVSAIVFSVAALVFSQLSKINFDFMPAARAIIELILIVYLVSTRVPEWDALGRNMLVETIDEGLIVYDAENVVRDFNKTAKDIFPDLTIAVSTLPKEILLDQFSIFGTNGTGDDTTRHYSVLRSPFYSKGKLVGKCAVINDITQQKLLDEGLKKENNYKTIITLMNSAPFSCLILDSEFNVFECNNKAIELLQFKDADDLKRNFYQLMANTQVLSDEDRNTFDLLKKAISEMKLGESRERPLSVLLYGNVMNFNLTINRLDISDKTYFSIFVSQVAESELRGKEMLEVAPYAAVFFDNDLSIIDCSDAVKNVFGVPNAKLSTAEFNSLFQNDQKIILVKGIREAFTKHRVAFDVEIVKLDTNQKRYMRVNAASVVTNMEYMVIAFFDDITGSI